MVLHVYVSCIWFIIIIIIIVHYAKMAADKKYAHKIQQSSVFVVRSTVSDQVVSGRYNAVSSPSVN